MTCYSCSPHSGRCRSLRHCPPPGRRDSADGYKARADRREFRWSYRTSSARRWLSYKCSGPVHTPHRDSSDRCGYCRTTSQRKNRRYPARRHWYGSSCRRDRSICIPRQKIRSHRHRWHKGPPDWRLRWRCRSARRWGNGWGYRWLARSSSPPRHRSGRARW